MTLTASITDRLAVVAASPLRSCDSPAVGARQLGVSGWIVLVRGGIAVFTNTLLQGRVKWKWGTGAATLRGRKRGGRDDGRRVVVVPGVIGGGRGVYVAVELYPRHR